MKQKLIYLGIVTCMLLVACMTFQAKIAPKAAAIVAAYCLEPQAERLLIRQQVAALTGANHIEIHCAGDQ